MFTVRDSKDFKQDEIKELFSSVGWELSIPAEVLYNAMMNSTNIITAWEDDELIGLARSMDDGCWSANIDCLIVRSDYQRRGVGKSLLNALLEKTENITYISVSPSDSANVEFYKKLGFKAIDGSRLLQIDRSVKD